MCVIYSNIQRESANYVSLCIMWRVFSGTTATIRKIIYHLKVALFKMDIGYYYVLFNPGKAGAGCYILKKYRDIFQSCMKWVKYVLPKQ